MVTDLFKLSGEAYEITGRGVVDLLTLKIDWRVGARARDSKNTDSPAGKVSCYKISGPFSMSQIEIKQDVADADFESICLTHQQGKLNKTETFALSGTAG